MKIFIRLIIGTILSITLYYAFAYIANPENSMTPSTLSDWGVKKDSPLRK